MALPPGFVQRRPHLDRLRRQPGDRRRRRRPAGQRGVGWHVDASAHALLDTVRGGEPRLLAVAGLPDGGAVAAGRDIVIERDGAGSPWRFSRQPLPGSTAIAAAAVRDGAGRAARSSPSSRSCLPAVRRPAAAGPERAAADPAAVRAPRRRLCAARDRRRLGRRAAHRLRRLRPRPPAEVRPDPGAAARSRRQRLGAWAAGAATADAAGRGTSATGGAAAPSAPASARRRLPLRRRAAALPRAAAGAAPVAMPAVRSASRSPATPPASSPAPTSRPQAIGPDRTLAAALRPSAASCTAGNGPRALLYTGAGRRRARQRRRRALRAAARAPQPSAAGLPGARLRRRRQGPAPPPSRRPSRLRRRRSAAAPRRPGSPPAGPRRRPDGGARTHYAFDSGGTGGTVRVIVIDNSHGSLAASDAYQIPPESQEPWLGAMLADAKARGIPRSSSAAATSTRASSRAATSPATATRSRRLLVDGGASAYLFERPEEHAPTRSRPARSPRSPRSAPARSATARRSRRRGPGQADSLFGDSGYLLAQPDAALRDPQTNRAPVARRG